MSTLCPMETLDRSAGVPVSKGPLVEQPAEPASEFCQRWSRGQHSWRHRSDGGFDPDRFRVAPIPEHLARQFVTTHHYAGSYPATRLAYGLLTTDPDLATGSGELDSMALVGAAALSVPMSAQVLTGVFPDLDPSLHRPVTSTHSYRSTEQVPVGQLHSPGVDPLTCAVPGGQA